jgi:hypothetical protein
VFVPSSPPAQRTFLVKQDWELKSLPPKSTDYITLSVVDKYAFRKSNPHLQELGANAVCLVDFAALFSPDQKRTSVDKDVDEDAMDDLLPDADTSAEPEQPVPLGHTFAEKRYRKRKQARILRYVHYKLHDNPEAYFREQILLFCPWSAEIGDPFTLSTTEDAYLLAGHSTFQSRYESVRSIIEKNRKCYNFNDRIDWDEVQKSTRELEEVDERLLQLTACSNIEAHRICELEEEKYDFGQDLGTTSLTASVSQSGIPDVRITDSDFRDEA